MIIKNEGDETLFLVKQRDRTIGVMLYASGEIEGIGISKKRRCIVDNFLWPVQWRICVDATEHTEEWQLILEFLSDQTQEFRALMNELAKTTLSPKSNFEAFARECWRCTTSDFN